MSAPEFYIWDARLQRVGAIPVSANKKSIGQHSRFVQRPSPQSQGCPIGGERGAKRLRNKSPFMHDKLVRANTKLRFVAARGGLQVKSDKGTGGLFCSQTPVSPPLAALLHPIHRIRAQTFTYTKSLPKMTTHVCELLCELHLNIYPCKQHTQRTSDDGHMRRASGSPSTR